MILNFIPTISEPLYFNSPISHLLSVQNRAERGSDDDSGKDSDEEELSKAKEKFEDFFQRTKKYWISFAREQISKGKDEGVSPEEYALVLAEEEFMKETIPALTGNSTFGGSTAPRRSGESLRREHNRRRNNPDAVQSRQQSGRHASAAPAASLQQQVNQLQHQLQRVDLDEGIE